MNLKPKLTYLAGISVLILASLISGCGVSKARLAEEERYVENLLNSWEGKTVEAFVKANPQVESLDLGGDKVRYTTYYVPPNNYEYYVIVGRYRYYALYFFVDPSGIIYETAYTRLYRAS